MTTADRTAPPFADALSEGEPVIRATLARVGAAPGDVDDLTQQVFARAWTHRESFDTTRPLAPWLARIALHVALDHRRQRATHRAAAGAEPSTAGDPTARRAEAADDVRRALAALTDVQRDVLLRFHRDGESLADIATALAMPLNTVKSHLHRARRLVRETGEVS